jgi:hypothetical protein
VHREDVYVPGKSRLAVVCSDLFRTSSLCGKNQGTSAQRRACLSQVGHEPDQEREDYLPIAGSQAIKRQDDEAKRLGNRR